jgi:transcription elongation factor Elf1
MEVKLKIVSKADPTKTRRSAAAAISWAEPPKGDCNVNCPACGFELESGVSLEFIKSIHTFTCAKCGAVSSPKT